MKGAEILLDRSSMIPRRFPFLRREDQSPEDQAPYDAGSSPKKKGKR